MIKLLLLFSCCLAASAKGPGPLKPSKVYAKAECGGELRLTVHLPKSATTKSVDKRDADEPQLVFEVAYKASNEKEDVRKQFVAHLTKSKGQYEALMSGLRPGEQYSLRVRVGESSDLGDVEFGEFSTEVKAVSGQILAEDGPAGIGEGRNYCRSRQRKVYSKKSSSKGGKVRPPRYTFYSRRRYTSYSSYYCYYSYSYYSCSSGSTSVGGIVAGAVVGTIFLVAAFIICCKFYFYGGCGRQPYRARHVVTSTVAMHTTVSPRVTAMPAAQAIPVAQPVAAAPDTSKSAAAAGTYSNPGTNEKDLYGAAPYPTPYPTPYPEANPGAYPAAGSGNSTYDTAAYPQAPYPTGGAATGYPNPAYPTANYPAAPPGYETAVGQGKY